MKFENIAKKSEPYIPKNSSNGYYTFDQVSPLMVLWSRLLQSIVSQAGTYLITGRFHDRECGIYKSEGGCSIHKFGDLVLKRDYCCFDFFNKSSKKENVKLADMISSIVLGWDPNNPIDTLLQCAADYISIPVEEFKEVINKVRVSPFSGNSLSSFFDYNPYMGVDVDPVYERFCLIQFDEKTPEDVDRLFADRELAKLR